MEVVLSVDWDFFFPNTEWYDWGHREAPFYIHHIWRLRIGNYNLKTHKRAIDEMRPDPNLLRNFWNRVADIGTVRNVLVSESHACAANFFGNERDLWLINFDAHHDIGYPDENGPMNNCTNVYCDNWVGMLMRAGKIAKYTIVYPEWRENEKEFTDNPDQLSQKMSREMKAPIDIRYGLNDISGTFYKPEKIFICRSGAWTPPWADHLFNNFVRRLINDDRFSSKVEWQGMVKRSISPSRARQMLYEDDKKLKLSKIY